MTTTTKPANNAIVLVSLLQTYKGFRLFEAKYLASQAECWVTAVGNFLDAQVCGWQAVATPRAGLTT